MTLKSNGNFSEWYDELGVEVECSGDGLRPVIFKLARGLIHANRNSLANFDGVNARCAVP